MKTINRNGCAAPRHGTLAAYHAGCRCADARDTHRLYYKRRRAGRPYRLLVDATGSRRRVQALYAIGHTAETIAATAGLHERMVQQIGAANLRSTVQQATATAIATAYRHLSGQPGTSATTRRRAQAAGYLSPVWWADAAEMDNPAADPRAEPATDPATDPDDVDDELVHRVLAGTPAALNPAERAAAVQLGLQRGLSPSRLGELLHTHVRTIHQLAANQAA